MSIKDLPIDNWIRLIEENDYSYLHRKSKKTILNILVFELIQDQIIDNFGVGDDFKKILRNQISMELMAIKQIKTGDYSTQAKIELMGLENEQILNILNSDSSKNEAIQKLIQWKQKINFFSTRTYVNNSISTSSDHILTEQNNNLSITLEDLT